MPSINTATLLGHAGKQPDLRTTQGGKQVATLRIATNDGYYDSEGKWVDNPPEWHTIVVWGEQAERLANEVGKGDLVFAQGKMVTRKWTDPQGIDHYSTEMVARVCVRCHYERRTGSSAPPHTDDDYHGRQFNQAQQSASGLDDYDIGDLGPPLDMDGAPFGP